MAAWLEEYGGMDAVGVIVLISSHDATDIPAFAKLEADGHPSSNPWLAIGEAIPKIARYLPLSPPANATAGDAPLGRARLAVGKAGLDSLLDEIDRLKVPACLIQHQTVSELRGAPEPGWQINREAFAARGWPAVQLSKWTGRELTKDPAIFADRIHLAPRGQLLVAEAIKECTKIIDVRPG